MVENENVVKTMIGEYHFPGFLHPILERNCMAGDHIYLNYRHQRWPLGYGREITYWWGTSKISKTVKCLAK